MAQAWLDTAKQRVPRYDGQAASLSNLDYAAMLIIILGAMLAWFISEMLDL